MEHKGHITVVDDDAMIRELLMQQLTRENYKVSQAATGEAFRKLMETEEPDLVILDLTLPDTDGFTVARELRANSDIGIIMLTGKGDTVDKIVGLEVGADDYITKPFDQRELLARVSTVLRRLKGKREFTRKPDSDEIEFEGWRLNTVGHELTSPSGDPVHLTSYEFRLLVELAQHANQVLSRDQLLDLVGNRDWSPFDRSIDVLVGKLRRKIEPDQKKPTFIKTIRGAGYKFTVRHSTR